MLGFFPTPYPDELLYSIIARYHIRSGSISPKATLQDLFGSTTVIATIDLPGNLNAIAKRIQHLNPNLSGDSLIAKHTLYPFYQPFLPPQRDRTLRRSMKANTAANIHTRAGVMASAISTPKYLRFCPCCNAEHLDRYGELYWQRTHQVSGVLVCPQHGVPLQDSSVHTQALNRHEYVAARTDNCLETTPDSFPKRDREILQTIATDIAWLLDRNLPARDMAYFQQQYRALLIERGLANSNGRIHIDRLWQDFRSFYSPELLTSLDSGMGERDSSWLLAIVRKHRKTFHPLRHLLFMHFLSVTIEEFFSNNFAFQPFGKPPWICLNAASSHYRQAVVTDLKLSHCLENKRPLGTFTCECGTIYCRTGPDRTEEDKYKIGKIIDFGDVWREKLRELVEVKKLSLRSVARELKVDPHTIKRYVSSLGLTSYWERRAEPAVELPHPIAIDSIESLLAQKREGWQNLQARYPQLSKTEIRKIAPDIYTWLYRHDRAWLNNNSPTLQTPISQKVGVDWQQRDRDVCALVQGAVESMLLETKPVRITMSRIGKEIGLLALLEQHLDLMPLTGEYLAKVVESIADFQIRRIRWAMTELDRRGEPVVEWRVIRLAGLGVEMSEQVQAVLAGEIGHRL